VKSMVMLVMVGWAMSEGEGELMWVVRCGLICPAKFIVS
jgi:hypothetical protein